MDGDVGRYHRGVLLTGVLGHFVRHGESEWNALGRMQGRRHDPPLTARGRRQAATAARELSHRRVGRLLSSNALRAVQTARIIAEQLALEVHTTSLLRERDWGLFEGMACSLGHRADALLPPSQPIPGGESRDDVARRLHRLARSTLINQGPESVVVITHGDVIREGTRMWGNASDASSDPQNGSVATLQISPTWDTADH